MKYSTILTCLATVCTAFPTPFSLPDLFHHPSHSDDHADPRNGTSCEKSFMEALNTTREDVRVLVNSTESCFTDNGTTPVANFVSCVETEARKQGVSLNQITTTIRDLQQSCHSKRGMYVDHPFVRCAPSNSSSCAQMVMNTLNTTTDTGAKNLYDTATVCLGNGTVSYKKFVACIRWRTAASATRIPAHTTADFLAKLKLQCAPNRRGFSGGKGNDNTYKSKKLALTARAETSSTNTAAVSSCLANAATGADLDDAQMELAQAAIDSCQSAAATAGAAVSALGAVDAGASSSISVYACMKTYINANDVFTTPRTQGVLAVAFDAYVCSLSASSSTSSEEDGGN